MRRKRQVPEAVGKTNTVDEKLLPLVSEGVGGVWGRSVCMRGRTLWNADAIRPGGYQLSAWV